MKDIDRVQENGNPLNSNKLSYSDMMKKMSDEIPPKRKLPSSSSVNPFSTMPPQILPLQKEKNKRVPPKKRRFDSIACLIQGDDKCGAACFIPASKDRVAILLLATNETSSSLLVDNAVKYLTDVSKFILDFPKIIKEKEILKKFAMTNVNEYAKNKKYKKAFSRALDKIPESMALSMVDPSHKRALAPALDKAIKEQAICFIEGTKVHAELKIIQYLWEKNLLSSGNIYYVGISKKCCKNCECTIQAVNNIYKNPLKEDVLKDEIVEEKNIIDVRGKGHQKVYDGEIPEFLKKDGQLQNEFLKIRSVKTLADAFYSGEKSHANIREEYTTSESSEELKISSQSPQKYDSSKASDSSEPEEENKDQQWQEVGNKSSSPRRGATNNRTTLRKPNASGLFSHKNHMSKSASKVNKMTDLNTVRDQTDQFVRRNKN